MSDSEELSEMIFRAKLLKGQKNYLSYLKTMKPITTLFLLMSVDGKISTGDNDGRDTDKDLH
ncbi:MAG: hypothetical protein WCL02_05760 [bacterium]